MLRAFGLVCLLASVALPASAQVLTATQSQTNVSCNGGANGSATVNASGGSAPYTYSWAPSGGTGSTASGLVAGSYTVTVTDAVTTSITRTFTITQPPAITVTPVSQTNVACNGGSNGAAQVSVSGGAPGYSYNWTPGNPPGDGTASVTGLTAGVYTVTVTDANGCTANRTFNITQPTPLVVTPSMQTNVACNGGSTGAAQINPASGGSAPYTYNWTPGNPVGDGTVGVTGLTAGVYTVTVFDANSCTATQTFNITQPASAVTGSTVVTNVACFGGNTGAINLTPSGGVGPYTYAWTGGGSTTEDRTGLVAGTYTVVITDANGCTGTVTATVTQPSSPISGSTVVTNIACFGGNTGAINLTPTGGIGPYTYSWNGGATTEDRTSLSAGTYTVTITDANGCTGTVTATVTQPAAPVGGSTVVTNVACFGGNTGAINLTPSGGTGPYSYLWTDTGVSSQDRTGLTAGTYTVIVTDVNGCTGTVTATVTQPASPLSGSTVVTNVACNGGNTGAINLTPTGGTAPYTYDWGGGITTEDRTGLTAGTYTVAITDANGCIGTVTATVTQPAAPVSGSTVVTNVACFGGNTGAINLTPTGGTGPYTYVWSGGGPTTEDRTGLVAGTYTVVITDANGCTGTVTTAVTQPTSPVNGFTVVTNVACFGGNTGAINLTPTGGTGPYTYNWGGGITTEDRTGLTAGAYTVAITDANACTRTLTVTVTQPATPVGGTTVVTNVACFGGNTGAINLTPSGGTGPYTYLWTDTGVPSQDRTGLTAGTYTVIVTDANGCTGTVTATVTQPASPLSGSTVVTNVACNGGNTGAINLTPTGGTAPYTYDWGGGITTEDRTGLTAGTYTVAITDANGCIGTVTATVTQPGSPVSGTTVVTNVACNGGNTGAINLTPTGGTGPYTYDWGGGVTSEDRTGLSAGTYTVVVTDANGCIGTVTATVTQPASPVNASTVVTNVACNGASTGAINLTPFGGTGPYTYDWGGGITTEDRTGLAAGTYTVVITDANACTRTVTVTVTQPATPVGGSTVVTNVACFGGNTGAINLTPSGGTGPYTYLWTDNGVTTQDRTGLSAGTYTVIVTDANGCTGTVTATVTQPASPVSGSTVVTNVACNGGNTGAINLTPTGGTGPYTYDWGGGVTTEDRTGLSAGTYTVVVTDANGCTGTVTAAVTQPAVPLSSTAGITNVSCNGGSNGAINVTPTGGTAPYTYDWGGGIATEDRTGLAAGSYTVVITDANGCVAPATYTVTEPAPLAAPTTATNVSCSGGTNGSATVTPSGGTGPYTYVWAPSGGTGATASGLAAGSYTVTVTDANGCSVSATQVVTQPAVLAANGSSTGLTATGTCTGSATVAPSGGTGPYSIVWSPSGATSPTVTALCGPTETATITDANGCIATYTATISGPQSDLSVTISDSPDPAQAGGSIAYTITASATAPAPNVVLSGAVPPGTSFESLTAPAGWTCTTPAVGGTGAYSCSTASLAAGSVAFTLNVGVPPLFGSGSVTATASISGAVVDAVGANDAASETTTVISPARLVAVKTVALGSSGSEAVWTIVITNNGPAAQVDDPASPEMTDTLPSSLVVVSATASGGTATVSGNTVAWNGSLAAGESVTVTIRTTFGPGVAAGTTILNQATIFYDADGNGTNEASEGSRPSSSSAPAATAVAAPAQVPLDPRVLMVLIATLGGVALLRMRG